MKRQAGFLGPLTMPLSLGEGIVKLGLILAIVSAIGGIVYAVKSYAEARDAAIFKAGQSEASGVWKDREIQREAMNRKLIDTMNERYKALQHEHDLRVAKIVQNYREAQRNADKKYQKALAASRAGTLRLRDPGRADSRAASGGRDSAGATGAKPAAPGADGTGGGYLSRGATEFLLGQAAACDNTVRKLGSLQDYTRDLWSYCSALIKR